MADLDTLVKVARDATIRRDVADSHVRELERWAARQPARRTWPLWAAGGLAMAAAAVMIFTIARPAEVAPTTVRIGDRVAIVAEPGTEYRVVEATAGTTTIEVEHGAVTARLWPGAAPHHLVLAGGGVTASAKGTIYQLAVTAGHASVQVAQGTVEVAEHGEVHRVIAGTAWPVTAHANTRGADTLLAMRAPEPVPAPPPAIPDVVAPLPDPVPPPAPPSPRPAPIVTPRDAASPVPSIGKPDLAIKDHWRDARLLRGQGRFADAVHECLTIADAGDATWSPIALVEAVRIEAGPLADPEQAVVLADRAIREWPHDALIGEVRALRCQALGQLGRADDCKRP